MTMRLSASGARIRGDEYQHLVTWWQALRAVTGTSDITKIGIEDPGAGNADDVTVYMKNGMREYYQVKASGDASNPLGMAWLMKPSRSGGSSILQGFYNLWEREPNGHKPTIIIVTNRLPPNGDVLNKRDGRNCTIARYLQDIKSGSNADHVLHNLVRHLMADESKVVQFFQDLQFKFGITDDLLTEWARERMYMAGLRHDEGAVARGISIARGWVTGGKREITAVELRQVVEPLKRPDNHPTASILVQAIDRAPVSEAATVALDWLRMFPGSEPRVRRQTSDPKMWNDRFRPELRQAAQELRSQGHAYILVKGYMRLPTWFVAGIELGKTAGFQVSSMQEREAWSSAGEPSDVDIKHTTKTLGPGNDLAVGIALAVDPSTDVLAYLRDRKIGVGKYVCIGPEKGASNQSIGSAAEARGWAYKTRDEIRLLASKYRPDLIHLFLAGPRGAMLLLGHLWDRMPSTQTYEDLGPGKGYAPSYLIPS